MNFLPSGLGANLAGLFDELEKIAEEVAPDQSQPKMKNWLKNTALIVGGTGAGAAAAMVADRLLSSKLGPGWARMNPQAKKAIVGSLMGATLVGSGLVGQKLMEERNRRDRE